jgi:hypothetical protein
MSSCAPWLVLRLSVVLTVEYWQLAVPPVGPKTSFPGGPRQSPRYFGWVGTPIPFE